MGTTKCSHPGSIERAVKFVAYRQLPVRYPQPPQLEARICTMVHGTKSDRRDVQSDGRDLVPELQVPVHGLDVGQG